MTVWTPLDSPRWVENTAFGRKWVRDMRAKLHMVATGATVDRKKGWVWGLMTPFLWLR